MLSIQRPFLNDFFVCASTSYLLTDAQCKADLMPFLSNRFVAGKSRNEHELTDSLTAFFRAIFSSRLFKISVFIAFLLFLYSQADAADEGVLKLTAGAEYTTGKYGGTESIDDLYVPLTVRYFVDRYVFRLTVPYLHVTAPAGTVSADGIVLPGTGERITESGVGDIIAGMTYRDALSSLITSDMALDFTAKVKFGTASESKGLGTGENDYTLQAELYKFLDSFTTFATLGYKFRGDPPGVDLSNTWLAYIGGSYRFTRSLNAGMDFYFQQAAYSLTDDQMELSAFLGYRLKNAKSLRGYLIKGLSDGSPDWGVGISITFTQ
jgi:hypothetical protein